MRVLLVANYQPDNQESMLRYAAWLERILKARGHQVSITAPWPFFSRIAPHPVIKKYLGYLDKFLLFPPQLRRLSRSYDLVHVLDHSNSMYLRTARYKPNLITCHDMLAIRAARGELAQVRVGWSGRLLQKWILFGLRRARYVLCVSAKTEADLKILIAGSSITPNKSAELYVIPNALNWSFKPGASLPEGVAFRLGLKPGEHYLLNVGGNQWYKNRVGALHIFARLIEREEFSATRLVMVGKQFTAAMADVIREKRLAGRVIEASGVTNEELQALYGNALALLFPSLEEGFGWPILEAQACGCPVIASQRPPMTEVAGEAAIFIDPADPQAAAATIATGLQAREQLRAAGFRNLERFNENKVADRYCALYESVLRHRPAPSA
jgi:glycosyltransferase involved in cell wall biosynthesis